MLDRTFGLLDDEPAWAPDDIAGAMEKSETDVEALLTVALWKLLLLADLRREDLEQRGAAVQERRQRLAFPFASVVDLFGSFQPKPTRTATLELAIDQPSEAPQVGSRVWFEVQGERLDGIIKSVTHATVGRGHFRTTIKLHVDGSLGSPATLIDPSRIVRADISAAADERRMLGLEWARDALYQPPFSDGTAPTS